MKKGKLLKPLGKLPAGKDVEVSDATFARLTQTGYFAKESKAKTETKEQKHGKATETKSDQVNAVVDSVIGQVDKSETPKGLGRKAKG